QRVVFQTEGQSLTPDDIARTVLLSHGAASVTLGNVADVIEAPEPPIGGASIQGQTRGDPQRSGAVRRRHRRGDKASRDGTGRTATQSCRRRDYAGARSVPASEFHHDRNN